MRATYQDIINRLDEIERHALRALGSGQEDAAHQVQLIITNAHARVSYGAWRRDGARRQPVAPLTIMAGEWPFNREDC